MRPDGTYIAASLEYWFTDSAKHTHYMVHAEFDAEDDPDGRFLTLLRLTNIEFGPPTVVSTAAIGLGLVTVVATGINTAETAGSTVADNPPTVGDQSD